MTRNDHKVASNEHNVWSNDHKQTSNGHKLLHLEFDKENQQKTFDLYRETNRLIQVDEIKETKAIFHHEPTIFTGQTLFNFEKFSNMVTYFAKKQSPYITKLNKLLFYADFLHFKYHKVSISGSTYNRLQYGPVPKRYNTLFESISKITLDENEFGIKAIAVQDLNEDAFTESEYAILQ